MPGIKETTEALIAVNELSLMMIEVLKDGAQFNDFLALYARYNTDPALKSKIDEGIANLKAVKVEVKDLDLTETAALIGVQVSYVPRLIKALE